MKQFKTAPVNVPTVMKRKGFQFAFDVTAEAHYKELREVSEKLTQGTERVLEDMLGDVDVKRFPAFGEKAHQCKDSDFVQIRTRFYCKDRNTGLMAKLKLQV